MKSNKPSTTEVHMTKPRNIARYSRGLALAALTKVTILALGHVALAQAQDTDVIKVDTTLVTINISVTNSKGRHLAGLKAEDFQVTDEGLPVRPEFFDSQGPASIVFVVDTSSSMKGTKWRNLKAGLKHFLADSHKDNDYTLIAFNETARLVTLSVSASELWLGLNNLNPAGDTALYDALLLGLDTLGRLPRHHKAVVLLSDGGDTSSYAKLPMVQQEAIVQRSTIYAVGILLNPQDISIHEHDGHELLKQLAAKTGGLVLFPAGDEIHDVLETINDDVRGQYSLSYYPPRKTPGRRTIQVSIARDPRRCKLRYQQTYMMK
jgi:VWFA-related protein